MYCIDMSLLILVGGGGSAHRWSAGAGTVYLVDINRKLFKVICNSDKLFFSDLDIEATLAVEEVKSTLHPGLHTLNHST
jgi:hypothetical protein